MLSLPHPTLLRMPQDQAVFAVSLSLLIWKLSSTLVCSLKELAGILISDVVERAKLLPQRCRVTRGILSQKIFSPPVTYLFHTGQVHSLSPGPEM